MAWLFSIRALRELPAAADLGIRDGEGGAAGGDAPEVSVVVAARDEAGRIETTVGRLLGQRGLTLEVIVVDDRSSDATPEILERLSRRDARLRPVRIDALPEGWIGKCWALETGGSAARGRWILFCDADQWMAPDLIVRAVRTAEAEGVEHLCLFPHQRDVRLSGRIAGLLFSMLLTGNAAGANRDRKRSFIGLGAFNLVRAGDWRAIGGHRPLRLEVCDDIKLGLLLKRAGRRSRAFYAGHDLEASWARSAGELVAALEKNMFAMLGYRVGLAAMIVALHLLAWGGAVLGPWTGRPSGIAAGLGLLLLAVPASVLSRAAGWGLVPPLLAPPCFPILTWTVARSTWTTLRQGGVRWRDTFYPLEVLRRGSVPWW